MIFLYTENSPFAFYRRKDTEKRESMQILFRFGGHSNTAFSFKKYCSSLVIVVKILIFAHSDAEAPP